MDDEQVDDDDSKRETIETGLAKLLRPEHHAVFLTRFEQIARTASRCREFASQLLNVHFQDPANQLPENKLQTMFYQAQGFFCAGSRISKYFQSEKA